MSHQFIVMYAFTIFIASIIPGPSMMLALTHGMQHGTRRTLRHRLWVIWWSPFCRQPYPLPGRVRFWWLRKAFSR